ncbi:MAG: hypothetical protein UY81_C0003G0013 [Candidatus Giovannonibacteria bacterium GW2011_GWA2_53_7]|uniref:NTP pyrophosphohydrolase MazG-like domain-containing protein n=1 Tax=Candidatus Giovannonibacteria bacterium GW2011_GWA2_53_7 TaxID=1618650 RepID=A0A0G1Y140_9BACT|nr:MAG: hypothetical protein UY81_C0003G0013 [Candidatus Giovannonibacteria bacterium GW2011_GWA2_53_7]
MNTDEIMRWHEGNLRRYEKKHGIVIDREVLLLKLMEETGEFAQALLILEDKCRVSKRIDKETAQVCVAEELGDVLGTVLSLAVEMKIDVFEELRKKSLEKGKVFLEKDIP